MPPMSAATASGSAPPLGKLARFGCLSCREQHLKYKFKFTKKQRWVKTPKRLVFIDESKAAEQDESSSGSGPDEFESETAQGSPPAIVSDDPFSNKTSQLPAAAIPYRPGSPTDRFMISTLPGPLANQGEAYLFRHFVEKLAVWLDLCDPKQTFAVEVPRRARGSPILLNAIFALSARHLGQTSGEEDFNTLAVHYNDACLKDLQVYTNHEPGWTEHLFLTTIILQVMEEMNAAGMPAGADGTGHLKGMYWFVQDLSPEPGSVAAACFWVGLRQDIYSAVKKRQQVRMNLPYDLVDRSLSPADDYTWANRAIVHCADVLNFCFGPERNQVGRWEELNEWNQDWMNCRPDSFNPLFKQGNSPAPFPAIWHHQSCHVIGVQHHLLARLFLLNHRLEFGTAVTAKDRTIIQERIRDIVREICGIGLGNQWTPPGMFTACMAIAAFGHYFHEKRDQREMLHMLESTQKEHARPTEWITERLCRLWEQGLTGRRAAVMASG
ncbi:hypothetical protein VTK26DRAFT_3366 [Humicola hyalothermophila]